MYRTKDKESFYSTQTSWASQVKSYVYPLLVLPQVDGGGGEVQGPEEHLDLVRSEAAAGDLHDVLGCHRQCGHPALDLQNMQGVFQPDRWLG